MEPAPPRHTVTHEAEGKAAFPTGIGSIGGCLVEMTPYRHSYPLRNWNRSQDVRYKGGIRVYFSCSSSDLSSLLLGRLVSCRTLVQTLTVMSYDIFERHFVINLST